MLDVSIVGGSGYTGGEALRLFLGHPQFQVKQVTSESHAGKPVHHTHPNLRAVTRLKYSPLSELESTDVLVLALPHGESQTRIRSFLKLAPRVVDLAADFRLKNLGLYQKYYNEEHREPELLAEFVYALPEIHREVLAKGMHLAAPGCNATCAITGLRPVFEAGIIEGGRVFIDAKVGSSAAGAKASPATHHPERSGALRSFKPTAHRHTAEIVENLTTDQEPEVHFSGTSTDAVRGILTTSQMILNRDVSELDIRSIYRHRYQDEPFVRIVKERRGIYRYPEPKLLAGTNFVDIGFELDPSTRRLVVMAAIDNLVKGSAGNAIQALNIGHGWPETTGLEFPGLHPC